MKLSIALIGLLPVVLASPILPGVLNSRHQNSALIGDVTAIIEPEVEIVKARNGDDSHSIEVLGKNLVDDLPKSIGSQLKARQDDRSPLSQLGGLVNADGVLEAIQDDSDPDDLLDGLPVVDDLLNARQDDSDPDDLLDGLPVVDDLLEARQDDTKPKNGLLSGLLIGVLKARQDDTKPKKGLLEGVLLPGVLKARQE